MKNETNVGFQMFREECFGDYKSQKFISINSGLSVKQAMHSLTEQAGNCEDVDVLFVVDDKGRYQGAMELKSLIIARQGTSLSELIDEQYPFVFASRPIDENIEQLKSFAKGSLPVLNEEYRLVGVISVEKMLDILDEEFGEDYARLAGLTDEEDLEERLGESMKKRLPWLSILLVLGLLVSSVIGMFEQIIEQLTLIVCFQSLILGMAGNGGTQSLAVTVRLLTAETLSISQRRKLLLKEIRVGFVNGGVLAVLSCIGIGLYVLIFQGQSGSVAFAVSACIGIALWCAMTLSAATGTLIPLMFKRMGVDPAVASGPLITTLNDLAAVLIYYGLAWLLLIRLLGFGA